MALEGQFADGIALLEVGIERAKAAGAQYIVPFDGAMLATAYQRTGRVEDGLTLIGTLLEMVERTGVRYMEAELYRVRAELLVSSSNFHKAEEALQQGLTVAREQQARWWESRASVSLARLWRDQGKRVEARDLLAPVYGWFTEGFDTADLRASKAMLEELGSAVA